ncbi:unnamed protein product [Lymnaea stagnalis]|uniref:Probable tRNA (uracil-O(2)-)-methyltransferase n=1 Tax=Lymnaea stagnalis TaxID=6523 RepID=A0AAV2I7L9_LYMST
MMEMEFMESPPNNTISPVSFTTCERCRRIQTTKGTEQLFLKSVSVWVNKPHVVNRRLCGSKIINVSRLNSRSELLAILQTSQNCHSHEKDTPDAAAACNFTDLANETKPFTFIIRELVPKSEFFPKLLEAVVYDKERMIVSFLPISQNCTSENEEIAPTFELKYSIQFQQINQNFPAWAQVNEMVLSWSCDHSETEETRRQLSSQWLHTVLLEKLVIWSHINDISTSATSLTLVPIDKYKDTYVRLKNSYGRELVKNWTERTDPKKFVYEDVAIAAYLLILWEEDRKKKGLSEKQSFVDLGCGNGLLVYILTKEGHRGLGIDLRKRNIWDTFGPGINLRVETISPSADHLYPECDWIIGNHSDELTPWIPVIAARSSYECCFFVLPCCHHDFVGKFGVSEKGKSRYESYLDYVKEIVSFCGFLPESDTLRIPSTKRICYIGRERSYKKEREASMDTDRQAYIDKRTAHSHSLISHRQKYPYVPVKKSLLCETQSSVTAPDAIISETSPRSDLSLSDDPGKSRPVSRRSFIEGQVLQDGSGHLPEAVHVDSQTVFENNPEQHSTFLDKRKCDSPNSAEILQQKTCEVNGVKRFRSGDEVCLKNGAGHLPSDVNSWDARSGCERSSCLTNGAAERAAAKQWATEFQPRIEQKIRNCQAVPEPIKQQIVSSVFKLVLNAPDAVRVPLETGRTWRKGGSVPLGHVAELFDKQTLHALKSECGGLQTLLRNHSHIFQVTGGQVQLRDFTQADPWKGRNPNKAKGKQGKQQRDTRKTTLCWFHVHHPEGCPRPSDECQFAHGPSELRTKQVSAEDG